jgi:SAM-dependent methyltransferase
MNTIDEQRREAFGEIAQLYDDARPVYPDALVDDVLGFSRFPGNGKILEIGCGTGIATKMFGEKGCRITGLEPAPEMAALARDKVRQFTGVNIIETGFEEWNPGDERFDLVVSAQAFHWIRPEIAYKKSALVLKPSGKLALFWNLRRPFESDLENEMANIYRNYFTGLPWFSTASQSLEASILQRTESIEASGFFRQVSLKRYQWEKKYTRKDYLNLLGSYADHHVMEENRKGLLFSKIAELLDRRGGFIRVPYLTVLYLAEAP